MATKTKQQARIITPEQLSTLRYPLPDSWKRAAGMLKGGNAVRAKNGTLVLPKYVGAGWKNAEIAIREYSGDRIVLERMTAERKKKSLRSLKAAAGILKGKIPDPVAWQHKIRKEWDRRLPDINVHH